LPSDWTVSIGPDAISIDGSPRAAHEVGDRGFGRDVGRAEHVHGAVAVVAIDGVHRAAVRYH
jgi:hypothetical protein